MPARLRSTHRLAAQTTRRLIESDDSVRRVVMEQQSSDIKTGGSVGVDSTTVAAWVARRKRGQQSPDQPRRDPQVAVLDLDPLRSSDGPLLCAPRRRGRGPVTAQRVSQYRDSEAKSPCNIQESGGDAVILDGLPGQTCRRVISRLEDGDQLGWCPSCRKVGSADPTCSECGAPKLAISLRDARATLAQIEADLDLLR